MSLTAAGDAAQQSAIAVSSASTRGTTPGNNPLRTPVNTAVKPIASLALSTPANTPANTPIRPIDEPLVTSPAGTPGRPPSITLSSIPVYAPASTPARPIDSPLVGTPGRPPANTRFSTPFSTPASSPASSPATTPATTPVTARAGHSEVPCKAGAEAAASAADPLVPQSKALSAPLPLRLGLLPPLPQASCTFQDRAPPRAPPASYTPVSSTSCSSGFRARPKHHASVVPSLTSSTASTSVPLPLCPMLPSPYMEAASPLPLLKLHPTATRACLDSLGSSGALPHQLPWPAWQQFVLAAAGNTPISMAPLAPQLLAVSANQPQIQSSSPVKQLMPFSSISQCGPLLDLPPPLPEPPLSRRSPPPLLLSPLPQFQLPAVTLPQPAQLAAASISPVQSFTPFHSPQPSATALAVISPADPCPMMVSDPKLLPTAAAQPTAAGHLPPGSYTPNRLLQGGTATASAPSPNKPLMTSQAAACLSENTTQMPSTPPLPSIPKLSSTPPLPSLLPPPGVGPSSRPEAVQLSTQPQYTQVPQEGDIRTESMLSAVHGTGPLASSNPSVPDVVKRQLNEADLTDAASMLVLAVATAAAATPAERARAGLLPWPYYFIRTRDSFTHELVPVQSQVSNKSQ